MSNYKILKYSYDQANKLNVIIKPSIMKEKKIDVFDLKGNYITSIGNINYSDYPYYIRTKGKEYANKRRKLYKIRHEKDRIIKGSRGWFSDKILW